jgi:hypothetical protein
MIADVPPKKQETVFWLLLGLGFAALLVGTLAHLSFVSGMGAGLILVGSVAGPILRRKNRMRG